ncbi:MAG: hypothetical protein RMJ54_08450 [Roseiflexaceae bacterium]|nr:hypothetical protein [Roseiflexaceae bacterium]
MVGTGVATAVVGAEVATAVVGAVVAATVVGAGFAMAVVGARIAIAVVGAEVAIAVVGAEVVMAVVGAEVAVAVVGAEVAIALVGTSVVSGTGVDGTMTVAPAGAAEGGTPHPASNTNAVMDRISDFIALEPSLRRISWSNSFFFVEVYQAQFVRAEIILAGADPCSNHNLGDVLACVRLLRCLLS